MSYVGPVRNPSGLTNAIQKKPASVLKHHDRKESNMGQIDNMSAYVKKNLKDTVKPRGGEHR